MDEMDAKSLRFVRAVDPQSDLVQHNLFHLLDVPCYGPQLLAYRVSKPKLLQLRSALRAIVEEGDGSQAKRFFDDHIEEHYKQAFRTRWRVPRSTTRAIGDRLAWWANQLTSDRVAEIEKEAGCSLPDAVALAYRLCPDAELFATPLRWGAVQNATYDLEKWRKIRESGGTKVSAMSFQQNGDPKLEFGNEIEAVQLGSVQLGDSTWIRELRTLRFDEPLKYTFISLIKELSRLCEPPDSIRIKSPAGNLRWIETCRFFLENSNVEVSAEGVENYMRDTVVRCMDTHGEVFPEPVVFGEISVCDQSSQTTNAEYAFYDVEHQAAVRSLEEILVGPYRLSRGPGPFMGPPRASTPLHDSGWKALPLFRVPEMNALLSRFDCLIDDALADAIIEVERASPSNRWWHELARTIQDERYGTDGPWKHFRHVQDSWDCCQQRFIALLRETQAADDAVVTCLAELDDQGPCGPPGSPEWGVPILVQETV